MAYEVMWVPHTCLGDLGALMDEAIKLAWDRAKQGLTVDGKFPTMEAAKEAGRRFRDERREYVERLRTIVSAQLEYEPIVIPERKTL